MSSVGDFLETLARWTDDELKDIASAIRKEVKKRSASQSSVLTCEEFNDAMIAAMPRFEIPSAAPKHVWITLTKYIKETGLSKSNVSDFAECMSQQDWFTADPGLSRLMRSWGSLSEKWARWKKGECEKSQTRIYERW